MTSQCAQGGLPFRYGFNACEAMFPPKGSKPLDPSDVQRTPAETRPLKCKNHDNDVLAGERNAAIASNIKKHASEVQN